MWKLEELPALGVVAGKELGWRTPMEVMLCTLGLCCWLSFVPLSAPQQSHSLWQRLVALPGLSTGTGCDTRAGDMYPPHFADVVLHFFHGISA